MTTQVIRTGSDIRVVVDTPLVAVGSVETLPNGTPASVTNVGTDDEVVFAFGIPEGPPGSDATVTAEAIEAAGGDLVAREASEKALIGVGEVIVNSAVPDHTSYFVSVMNAAGPGARVTVKKGNYTLNNFTITVPGQSWDFETGCVITTVNAGQKHAMIISAPDVTISGGVFDNGAPSTDSPVDISCILVSNADRVTIKNSKFRRARGACIAAYDSSSLRVEANEFTDTWYAAVFVRPTVKDISNIIISNNKIVNLVSTSAYYYGLNVHTDDINSYKISNVSIVGNTLVFPLTNSLNHGDVFPLPIEVYGGPAVPGTIFNVSITGNVVTGGGDGISVGQVNNLTITGNTAVNQYFFGIEVVNPVNVSVTGNSVSGAKRGIIVSKSGSGVTVVGNTVNDTKEAGIYISSIGQNISVSGNTVVATNGVGVYLLETKFWNISNNILQGKGTGAKAVVLDTSDNGVVSGNIISNWTENAVLIFATTSVFLDRIKGTGNNCFSTVNSLTIPTQLSGGASIGSFVSWIENFSDVDGSYRRDYLDVLTNRVSFTGPGSPEGVFGGAVGSVFYRTDGGPSSTFYIKESGTGATGWVGK